MSKELKQVIANYMFNNNTVFGLVNHTTNKFKTYIYDSEGEYLIGGKEVAEFISSVHTLI